jgi:hypothetical protein
VPSGAAGVLAVALVRARIAGVADDLGDGTAVNDGGSPDGFGKAVTVARDGLKGSGHWRRAGKGTVRIAVELVSDVIVSPALTYIPAGEKDMPWRAWPDDPEPTGTVRL